MVAVTQGRIPISPFSPAPLMSKDSQIPNPEAMVLYVREVKYAVGNIYAVKTAFFFSPNCIFMQQLHKKAHRSIFLLVRAHLANAIQCFINHIAYINSQ